MPLLALKHRCKCYLREQAALIQCFEQASFMHALANRQAIDVLDAHHAAQLGNYMKLLGSIDFIRGISDLRRAYLPLEIKIEIFKMLATDRLRVLKVMYSQAPSQSAEERYVATMLSATGSMLELFVNHSNKNLLAMFFNDCKICSRLMDDKSINLPSFEELFDWPADSEQATIKAAKSAFSSLLRGRNRRAKYFAFAKERFKDFARLHEFFTRQEAVLKELIAISNKTKAKQKASAQDE